MLRYMPQTCPLCDLNTFPRANLALACRRSYRLYYVLSCLTPMHEHRLLPGVPHFLTITIVLLVAKFWLRTLLPLSTCFINHVHTCARLAWLCTFCPLT
jgi:hypothetical protein